jgi:DeoR family transcriptional regulator, glycerol-3-phosphate regulon repressor
MVAAYRREAILELAKERSELSVEEIARRFGVSRETVRRDLTLLQSRGLLRRVHGGAMPAQTAWEAAFRERLVSNADGKRRIARIAAALFRENDTLMIDTGSTTAAFAAELAAAPRLTVITNCLSVASRLAGGASQHRVYVIGGEFRAESQQTLGSACLEQISRYRADHAVMSCGGIDPAGGLMDFDFEEAMVARAMISQSQRLTVIVDQSKFDRVAMAKVCDLGAVDRLVTDAAPPPHLLEAIEASDVELIVAGEDASIPAER